MEPSKPDNTMLVVIIGLVLLFMFNNSKDDDGDKDSPSSNRPAERLVTKLRQIRRLAGENPEAAKALCPLYAASVRIAQRSDIRSYQQFIHAIVQAETTKVGLNTKIQIPGWSEARAEFFNSELGKRSVGLDEESRAKLVSAVKAVCWALENPE